MPTANASVTLRINTNPIPASRPRVGRWGTYYGKKYKQWMTDAEELLDDAPVCFRSPVSVDVWFMIERAKTSSILVPVGDGDNFEKGLYDLIQKKGYLEDDRLITSATWRKRFVPHGSGGYTEITIKLEEEDIEITGA